MRFTSENPHPSKENFPKKQHETSNDYLFMGIVSPKQGSRFRAKGSSTVDQTKQFDFRLIQFYLERRNCTTGVVGHVSSKNQVRLDPSPAVKNALTDQRGRERSSQKISVLVSPRSPERSLPSEEGLRYSQQEVHNQI